MILTTINQFTKAIPTAVGVENFADLETYVESAEMWFQNKILGATLYARVEAFEDLTNSADIQLNKLCISSIANEAYWNAIPFLDLVHTNSGFGVINNNNKAPASKERVERLRKQCIIRRDNEVENLITFLEQNTSYHDDWKGSPSFSLLTDCLIWSADELKRYASWEGTRKDFLLLKPRLIHFTMQKLQPVFSKSLIESLIEKQRDSELSTDETTLLDLLKHSLGCLIDDKKHVAAAIGNDALRFIDDNIASFPVYTASAEYSARTTTGYENELESTIFSSLME